MKSLPDHLRHASSLTSFKFRICSHKSHNKIVSFTRRPCKAGSHLLFLMFKVDIVDILLYYILVVSYSHLYIFSPCNYLKDFTVSK